MPEAPELGPIVDREDYGRIIRGRRTRLGMDGKELAEKLRKLGALGAKEEPVSFDTLLAYERGEREVPLNVERALLVALDVPRDFFDDATRYDVRKNTDESG